MVQTKLFSDLYLVKFLNTSAKNRSFRVRIATYRAFYTKA